ncbi:uncharacterized protein Triagg1_5874 [Trichoderma aggressivum f. europaeum]|uniref:FAR1 domain-containing protein n=1 Tax=Trichoderma aggressivum f. europaeum TaxID=173218 RepID=A0AAE1LZW0_9HYPO|nr:hypothetical protein Triagg1_5874 [Trichoderma aggressivum f. europaeum]
MSSLIGQTFLSFEEAYDAIQRAEYSHGFITIKERVNRRNGVVVRGEVRCRHSGIYRQYHLSRNKYITSTRKTDCPFFFIVARRTRMADYIISARSSQHNHEPASMEDLQNKVPRPFGIQDLFQMVESRLAAEGASMSTIARDICNERPSVNISEADIFFIQRKLREGQFYASTEAFINNNKPPKKN